MAIHHYNYMITANPPASRNGDTAESVGHHVRLMPSTTVSTRELAEKMHKLSPVLSTGVCQAAIDALGNALGELLADGHLVGIDGIGIFQPRLSGRVHEGGHGLAAQDVRISGVLFTPDGELLAKANEGQPTLSRRGTRALPSPKEISDFLADHFAQHDRLTRKNVVERFGITKDQAFNLLQSLVNEGKLTAKGSRATAHYVRRIEK